MSKRELGKLANVVDVDAPRAKRRREAVPLEEKKPDTDVDVDVTGEANVKREQEDTTDFVQVKEQGLKLWQTVKDAVDKECVTDLPLRVACLRSLLISTMISPAAAHFQLIFSVSLTNACTLTITLSSRSPSPSTRSSLSSTWVNTNPY
jgi:hypothetical protein